MPPSPKNIVKNLGFSPKNWDFPKNCIKIPKIGSISQILGQNPKNWVTIPKNGSNPKFWVKIPNIGPPDKEVQGKSFLNYSSMDIKMFYLLFAWECCQKQQNMTSILCCHLLTFSMTLISLSSGFGWKTFQFGWKAKFYDICSSTFVYLNFTFFCKVYIFM